MYPLRTFFVGLCFLAATASAQSVGDGSIGTLLDAGYRQMYNLDFGAARKSFSAWEAQHPDDPLGSASMAAAYLFAELDRLRILQSEFFVHDENFRGFHRELTPLPESRREFDKALSQCDQITKRELAANPNDGNALFAKVLADGLRSDYEGLIEKHYLDSLSSMKEGRQTAEHLLTIDPNRYDAYLAIGVENYMLSLKPAPLRWLLRIGGAQTDKEEGLKRLHLTAERGHYFQPFARLLVAVAALRDNDPTTAKNILRSLSQEFPRNHLYSEELSRLR
jgi:hypothetical protein